MSAREEIGRAMADKIREFESSKDLKRIAEDVLPELEKFLESPAEKRLRRIRNGYMVACYRSGGIDRFIHIQRWQRIVLATSATSGGRLRGWSHYSLAWHL